MRRGVIVSSHVTPAPASLRRPVRLGVRREESAVTRGVVVVPAPHLVDGVGRAEAHRAEGDEHHRDGEEHPGHLRTRGVGGAGRRDVSASERDAREAEGRGGATRLDASGRTEGRPGGGRWIRSGTGEAQGRAGGIDREGD